MAVTEPAVANDLLWGVEAIAQEIGLTVRMTYWRLERGELPVGKVGQTYVGSRQALRKHFQDLTAKAQAPLKCVTDQVKHQTRRRKEMKKEVKKVAASG
jgi:hypothetical protein